MFSYTVQLYRSYSYTDSTFIQFGIYHFTVIIWLELNLIQTILILTSTVFIKNKIKINADIHMICR